MSTSVKWLDALDTAVKLWRDDDFAGALSALDYGLSFSPGQPFLRWQKFLMQKAIEIKSAIKPISMPLRNPGDPAISVITATYNRNLWIRESIQSVIDQKFTDWELIVVNDGGGPEAGEIVSGFRDSRIRYVPAQHGGLAHALNRGLEHARGKYIAFLDDDDIYYPEHLEKLAAAMESNPDSPACYSDYILASQTLRDGNYVIKRKKRGKEFDFDIEPLILRNQIQPNTILVRREGFLKHGGFNEALRYTLDREMWLRLASDGKFVRVHEATTEYRKREDGSSMTTDPNFRVVYFSNILITLHKKLLFDRDLLGIWKQPLNVRAMKYLMDRDPDIIGIMDIRDFFEVAKPYSYFIEIAKSGALSGDRVREKAAITAAAVSSPLELKLWTKIFTGVSREKL